MFEVGSKETVYLHSEWMAEVDKHANKNICKILVGNKKDLED